MPIAGEELRSIERPHWQVDLGSLSPSAWVLMG
jgi:hypothetical protein